MAAAFVNLHTHSSYSPMQGVPTLEALCQAVRAQGHDTLALTDTNGLYGAIRFLDVAREAGMKPILGAELIHEITELCFSPKHQTAMPTSVVCSLRSIVMTLTSSGRWLVIVKDWCSSLMTSPH